MKNAVYGIFVENPNISIGVDIHFQRFELKAGFIWLVVEGNGAEVREIGLRADGCVLRDDNRNLIPLVLIGERFDCGQCRGNPALCMTLIVAKPGGCSFTCRFLAAHFAHTITSRRLAQLDLFHPFQLP